MAGATFTAEEAVALVRAMWPLITTAIASDVYLETWFEDACDACGLAWYGSRRLRAVAAMLAHLALRHDPNGVLAEGAAGLARTGQIASVSTKSRSISWAIGGAPAPASFTDADLATTKPGMYLLTLKRRSPGNAPFFIGSC